VNRKTGGSDPFEMDDAAYLLGALSPQERARYEQHLQTCEACSRSLTELAGLPGVLRRLPVEVVESMDADDAELEDADLDRADAPPASMLAGLLERAEQEERGHRRVRVLRWATAVTAAAAAVVVGTLAVVGPRDGGEAPVTEPPPDATLELEPQGDTELTGNVSLREVAWGTKIQVECFQPAAPGTDPSAEEPQYSLVVLEADGDTQQVATWNAVPGKELTMDAATAVRRGEITAMEVRSQDGTVVLRTAPE
jgi:hypothetical protein